jgi:predicted Ser/Thr protein kinase
MDAERYVESLRKEAMERFSLEKRQLSFAQYMAAFSARPHLLGRSGAQFILATLDHFGRTERSGAVGRRTRFGLFDAPFDGGRERLIGQEEVQEAFYHTVADFVRERRTGRLLLLHGPNGSAKTTFVQCLARAMVHYSKTEEGGLYSFNWVFPRSSYLGKRVGFESGAASEPHETYAFLDERDVAAVIPGDLRDHPIFLLPAEERQQFLDALVRDGAVPEGFHFSDHLVNGDLSPVSRRIFDALLAAYGGDLSRVLAHVQVVRFYMSRRYRTGIVTIEPQMHVDASIRQITMDESYANLPAVLRHVPIFELSGDLVDANRGLIEFSDLLKRPIEAFKYLLGTCETARITVGGVILYLDILFVGTTNDKYVDAFTRTPDFPSFKGRMELIRVPYLRNYEVEREVYDMQFERSMVGRHVSPHATWAAALWAVLTRLRRPDPEGAPAALKGVLEGLSPMAKADLYAHGRPPSGLKSDVARELVQSIGWLSDEGAAASPYEGGFGASPREVRGVLMAAGRSTDVECLHPVGVFQAIRDLCRQKALYEFLQFTPSGEYHDVLALLEAVIERYTERVDREFQLAMGLVSDDEFERLLQRYATHVSAFLKKESVMDPITRLPVPADEAFLKDIEDRCGVGEARERARQDFLGRIASFSLDNPGVEVPYRTLYEAWFEKLRTAYFREVRGEIHRTLRGVMDHLDGTKLSPDEDAAARKAVANLVERFGYCEQCVGPTVSFLAARKYQD